MHSKQNPKTALKERRKKGCVVLDREEVTEVHIVQKNKEIILIPDYGEYRNESGLSAGAIRIKSDIVINAQLCRSGSGLRRK